MIFDLFHSISDPVVKGKALGPKRSFDHFLTQTQLAEEMGFDTVWMAESHFSSETQKQTSVATIPHFHGEVGINSDSFQWFHVLRNHTNRINFGTAIHNIVGGSGGPVASADRVNTLDFINRNYWSEERTLRIGVASGRFPYQNTAFGIVPRNEIEEAFWPILKRTLFVEALEIFLRLLRGEVLDSSKLIRHQVTAEMVDKFCGEGATQIKRNYPMPFALPQRWVFENMSLVPAPERTSQLRIVLGSSDPQALELGLAFWDLDLFNLSFTPPAEIEKLHGRMNVLAQKAGRKWSRERLPRTVLVFAHPQRDKARELANQVLDTYIEAMRGTAAVPDKSVLMERALIGDAAEIRDQLHPENPRGFHLDDRLMLWFEFNQLDNDAVSSQMKYFHQEVMSKL